MGGIHIAGAAIGAMLAGIVSRQSPALMFGASDLGGMSKPAPRPRKRRPGRVHRGWTPSYFEVNRDPACREATRRRRQIAAGSLRVENGLVP